jgi:flavin reductase (DIM6/NTAB) family NADH-FMN oxidoreductase RutF
MKSGKKLDKFKHCGFTKLPSEKLDDCPVIADCPINLECKVKQEIPLGSHSMFLAEIVNIRANDDLINEDGRLMLHKAKLIAY